jgi:hypothetical protein
MPQAVADGSERALEGQNQYGGGDAKSMRSFMVRLHLSCGTWYVRRKGLQSALLIDNCLFFTFSFF